MATDTADAEMMPVTTSAAAGPDPTTHVWQVPMFLFGVAVFVAAWQGWLPLGTPDPAADFARDLAALRVAYEKVTPDRDELKDLLGKVATAADAFPEHAPLAHFALGSGYVRLAELTASPEEARTHWTLANQHFALVRVEQLKDPDDRPRLAFRSAKATVGVGLPPNTPPADIRRYIALLASGPTEEAGEAGRLQADLAMRLAPPDLQTARESLTRYLTATGIATPTASLMRAKLLLGEIHTRKNEFELARKWLSEIGADAPPEVIAPGKLLLARVLILDTKDWKGAARELEVLRGLPNGVTPALRAASAYHLAECKANLREPEAAAKLYEEAVKGDGPEAVATSVRLAEMNLKGSDRSRHAAAADLLAHVVKSVTEAKGFRNPLIKVADVQAVFVLAVSVLMADGSFEAALKAVNTYAVLASGGWEREKRAEVLAGWAGALQKENGDFKPKATAAAAEYVALASLQPAATAKVDMFRRAAAMYRLAEEPAKAIETLQAALGLPKLPDAAVAATWLDLVDALIAANRPDEVVPAVNKIMAQVDPLSTATRYRLARQFADTHKPEFAPLSRALFEQIAKQEMVTQPEQEFHERAMVELAHEYIRAGKYGEAETWLRTQLSMYKTGPESSLGRLLRGVCLLQLASTQSPGVDPASAAVNATKMREEALLLFKEVVKDTEAKLARDKTLGDRDAWLRREGNLRILQAYQQLRKPDLLIAEAISLRDQYHGTVEELIIMSLVYRAFKQKNQNGQALQTRDQMKELFDRLPASAFTATHDEYSRDYWVKVWFADK